MMPLDLHELKKMKIIKKKENNRLDSPRETNGCDDNHENSTDVRTTTNSPQHQSSRKPFTQQ